MELDDFELYGGLAGARLPFKEFDFGRGITVSCTYAHLMAPFLMAFAPAERGRPHPAPWRGAKGGFGFEIHAQVHVPREFKPSEWFDRLNTVWWFVALLRFRASPLVIVPVVASGPFAKAKDDAEEIHFWPMEVEQRLLMVEEKASHEIREDDLNWIRRHWWDAGKLMNRNREFNLLFQACTQCVFTRNAALALLSLWGALEGVFSPSKTELRFRVSANIAAYLEPPGLARLELQKKVAKLYDARSHAAHGGAELPKEALRESYALTKRVITKVIEANEAPKREELDAALFGAGDG
jgi:hypothetical protein